jgi:NitT/TauT family transport system substrate-binding protein
MLRATRREVIAGMGAVGVVGVAGARPSAAQAPQKLRVSTIPIIDTAPLAAAVAQGYFKEEGLEVDTTPIVGGAVGLPAVAAGQVQIGYSNLVSIVLGARQGLGFRIIAAGSASGDAPPNTAGLFAKIGSGLKTGADLEGKRIGVNTRNSINWLVVREWVRLNGGNPDRLTFLEVPFPSMADALRGNQIDAGYTVEPFLSAAVKSGTMEILGWPYDRIMKRVPISQFVATKSYLDANPQIVERWVRAYNRGIDWMNENQRSDAGVKLIAAHTRMTSEQVRTIAMPLWEKTVIAASIAKVVKVMQQHRMLEGDGKVDVDGLIYQTAAAAK